MPEAPRQCPAAEPDPLASPALDEPAAPMETPPPAAAAPQSAPEPVSVPVAAPAPPPILRTPPSTPAERAAVFAGAFGKKPSTAAPPQTASEPPATEPETSPSNPSGPAPPSNDVGLAVEAETTPAQSETVQPHPAMATAQPPSPLVYEPLPEIEVAPPVTHAEPLFAIAPRDAQSAPPLFPPAGTSQSGGDTDLLEREQSADPDETNGADAIPRDEIGELGVPSDEPEALPTLDEAEFQDIPEPSPNESDDAGESEPVVEAAPGDRPPGIQVAMEDGETDRAGTGRRTDFPRSTGNRSRRQLMRARQRKRQRITLPCPTSFEEGWRHGTRGQRRAT